MIRRVDAEISSCSRRFSSWRFRFSSRVFANAHIPAIAIALGTTATVQAEEMNSHTGERIAAF
jgi:hypothetical protein